VAVKQRGCLGIKMVKPTVWVTGKCLEAELCIYFNETRGKGNSDPEGVP
jgi:hypothetical protein